MDPATPYYLQSLPALLLSIVILVLLGAFAAWLGLFVLNQVLDTSREGRREHRWSLARHLGFGSLLLGLAAVLVIVQYAVYYVPYEPPLPTVTRPAPAGQTEVPVSLEPEEGGSAF